MMVMIIRYREGVTQITVLVSHPVLTRAVPCRVASTLIRPAASSLPGLLSAHTNQVIPLSVKRCSLPARSSDLRARTRGAVDMQELPALTSV
jgi:hypothetical protein